MANHSCSNSNSFKFDRRLALGKTAYIRVNPLPENASVIYSNQVSQTDSLNLVVFGESTLMEDLFYQISEDYK